MIKVEHLSRSYGDLKAVDDVSFEIGRGEVVGLLGHNGAGKTTIMKMLTGFLEPSAGSIAIDGLSLPEQRREAQARTGYLPENCPIYPEMTVIDFLEYQAGLRGVDEPRRGAAVREAIARTALEPKAADPISTLSRGYRQRVGVAQAILHRPRIYVLDEPTNGLDPTQIQHMRGLIRDLAQDATVIVSTHILQEVQATCDRVLIMRAGRMALDQRLADLARSRRLLVAVDAGDAGAEPLLAQVAGVGAVRRLDGGEGHRRYALDLAEGGDGAAPEVARALIEGGCRLYALEPERRDLEGVFGEINAELDVTRGGKEVAHA
jgi:ABC-2 type transport system ATP-binding protein